MHPPSSRRQPVRLALAATALVALSAWAQAADKPAPPPTQPCRLSGLPNELQCGSVKRALDPSKPEGTQIEVHYVVLPALARNKLPDPVLFLAGGPGQSSINVASAVLSRFSRLNNRRDLVFVDQRGTGKSAPLECPDPGRRPLAEMADNDRQLKELEQCRENLQKLPYGDLRFFTTTIAMQDVDAVRQALGANQWNVIGGSYGTRAALELQRQFPQTIRRLLIDGLAPPDMILPASFSTDTQAAGDAMFEACEKEDACNKAFPKLREQWAALLKSVPRTVQVTHPVTGRPDHFVLSRRMLLSALRGPLYSPAQAAALPAAIAAAADGRFEGLIGLSSGGTPRKGMGLAMGMHFSVVCAEDVPRLAASTDKPGADFGDTDAQFYLGACKNWPRGSVPEAFYGIPKAPAPVLLMSGAIDPVTPPRHGEHVAKALGEKALHVVVPATGHGVMALACMRDVVFRFIDAKQDSEALKLDASCAAKIPRPTFFLPIPDAPREAQP